MKWFNEDKTKMIDIDAINGYVYIPAKEYVEQNPTEPDVQDFKDNGDRIELIIGGAVFVFRGDTARQLYNLIIQNEAEKQVAKQLLKG
jgi:hypothetical protein